jgi:hypothetical protein
MTREFAATFGDPARARLRVLQEFAECLQVFVRERGQRLAQLDNRPQQEPLGWGLGLDAE